MTRIWFSVVVVVLAIACTACGLSERDQSTTVPAVEDPATGARTGGGEQPAPPAADEKANEDADEEAAEHEGT